MVITTTSFEIFQVTGKLKQGPHMNDQAHTLGQFLQNV
jgi:hypothetical protein